MIKQGIAFSINNIIEKFNENTSLQDISQSSMYNYIQEIYYMSEFKVYLIYSGYTNFTVMQCLDIYNIPYDYCVEIIRDNHNYLYNLLKYSEDILYYVTDNKDTGTNVEMYDCHTYSPFYKSVVNLGMLDNVISHLPVQRDELIQMQDTSSVVNLSTRDLSIFLKDFNDIYNDVPLICYNTVASKVDFSGLELSEAVFDRAYLYGAKFNDTDLSYATFREAYLYQTNFKGAYLNGVDFTGAYIFQTDFTNVNTLNLKSLVGATIHSCIFPKHIITFKGTFNSYYYDLKSKVSLVSYLGGYFVRPVTQDFLNKSYEKSNNPRCCEVRKAINYFSQKEKENIV